MGASSFHADLFDERLSGGGLSEDKLVGEIAAVVGEELDFHDGEMIFHPKFGTGRILSCLDRGENLKVSIQFQSEMHPRLLSVKYANLRKMDASKTS